MVIVILQQTLSADAISIAEILLDKKGADMQTNEESLLHMLKSSTISKTSANQPITTAVGLDRPSHTSKETTSVKEDPLQTYNVFTKPLSVSEFKQRLSGVIFEAETSKMQNKKCGRISASDFARSCIRYILFRYAGLNQWSVKSSYKGYLCAEIGIALHNILPKLLGFNMECIKFEHTYHASKQPQHQMAVRGEIDCMYVIDNAGWCVVDIKVVDDNILKSGFDGKSADWLQVCYYAYALMINMKHIDVDYNKHCVTLVEDSTTPDNKLVLEPSLPISHVQLLYVGRSVRSECIVTYALDPKKDARTMQMLQSFTQRYEYISACLMNTYIPSLSELANTVDFNNDCKWCVYDKFCKLTTASINWQDSSMSSYFSLT